VPEPLPPVGATLVQPGARSLDDLERMALANHPALAEAAARVDAARAQWLQVGLRENPAIGYESDDIGEDGAGGKHGGFVQQTILTGGKRLARRAVADRQIIAAEQQWAAARWRVLTDVRRRYNDVVVAQRRIKVTSQLVEIGRKGVDIAGRLRKARLVSDVDVLRAEVELQNAEILHGQARITHQRTWRALAAVVGDAQLAPAELVDNLERDGEDITWQGALERLWAESPEVAAALAEADRARAAVSQEIAESVPNFTVRGGVQQDLATQETLAVVGLEMPLQLYNRNQGNIARAQAEVRVADQGVRRLRLDLANRLADELGRYRDARLRVERYREQILPKARRSLDLITRGYEAGELEYLNLLDGQRTWFQSNLSYLEALQQMRDSAALVRGYLLDGSLSPLRR